MLLYQVCLTKTNEIDRETMLFVFVGIKTVEVVSVKCNEICTLHYQETIHVKDIERDRDRNREKIGKKGREKGKEKQRGRGRE